MESGLGKDLAKVDRRRFNVQDIELKQSGMERIELEVTSREVLGKKVSFLRRQGITPVHLFGHSIESLALQCDTAKLQHALAQAGQTGIITLKLGNERRPRPVVVREVQRALRKGELLHVDFYQVKMA